MKKRFKHHRGLFVLLLLWLAVFALSASMETIPGDIDKDGSVTAADARIVLRIAVGLEKSEDYAGDSPVKPGGDTPRGTDVYPTDNELTVPVAVAVDFKPGTLQESGAVKPYTSGSKTRLVTNELLQLAAGGAVTVENGYEYCVCIYDFYEGNDNFRLRSFRAYSNEPFAVEQNCIALVGLRKTSGAAFTANDIANAQRQIHLPLRSPNVSDVINHRLTKADLYQVLEIPPTAQAYYDLFEATISAEFYEKTELVSASDTADAPVMLYRLSTNNAWMNSSYVYQNSLLYEKKKILITGSVHGNERTPPTSILSLANNLTKNPAYAALLGQYDWYFVPILNPWGYSHSLISSSGAVLWDESSRYRGSVPSGYTLVENTPLIQGGIRRDVFGRDINRDYSDTPYMFEGLQYGFKTPQANALLDLCRENHFSLVLDIHQSQRARNASMDIACGFASMQYQASPTQTQTRYYTAINGANAKTDSFFREKYGLSGAQDYSVAWAGSNLYTMRNYFGGYSRGNLGNAFNKEIAAEYSICVETSQVCYPISGLSEQWYNSIATNYSNNYLINVAEAMAPLLSETTD